MIGHNGYSFDDVVAENLERGIYWAQRDALIRIIRDPEMGSRHEIVLAEIVAMTNTETGTCYPGRKWLAEATGYTEGTIATTIKELVAANYLVSTRRAPDGGTRALAHYAIVKPTVDELRAAVDAHIASIRATNVRTKEPSTRWADVKSVVHITKADVNPVVHLRHPDVNPVVHVNSPNVNPVIHVNEMVADAKPKADVNPVVTTVTSSLSNLEETPVTNLEISRPKRLPGDWTLPRSWGMWAIEHFVIGPDEVRCEAASFRDHWVSQGNTRNASKKDWQAAWRNWIRNSRRNWQKRKPEISIAPEFTIVGGEIQKPHRNGHRTNVMQDALDEIAGEFNAK